MAQTQIGVMKTGEDNDGERFMILIKDPDYLATKPGMFMETIDHLTEAQVREQLQLMGQAEGFTDRCLRIARSEFKKPQGETQ